MREILFRGKEVESGDWYYGDIFHSSVDVDTVRIHDYRNRANVKIIPETLGQFTGLTDKNGTKIFEGDIVRHYCKLPVPGGEIGTDRGTIKWDSEECFFFRTSLDGKDKTISAKCEYEIIGNIYDNPELIGDERNEP